MLPLVVCSIRSLTSKVYDACRSRECIPDLRVFLTRQSQELLDRSSTVKPRRAELIWVDLDVEPVDFNRGFFSVDARFYYRVFAEVSIGCGRMTDICGLAVYDKRTILFGGESSVRTFSSESRGEGLTPRTVEQGSLPRAEVETVDPIVLSAKIVEPNCRCECCCQEDDIPEYLGCLFDEDLILDGDVKKLFVTLGQFSIIRLERDIQLLIPAYDVCVPAKECNCGNSEPEDPCEVFDQIDFPLEEFYPSSREPRSRRERRDCANGQNGQNGPNGQNGQNGQNGPNGPNDPRQSRRECRSCGSR